MNINWIKLKGVTIELRGIRSALERLADCWEAEMAESGVNMRPPKANTSGPEPTVSYVDEEMDYVRESIDRFKREDEMLDKEE